MNATIASSRLAAPAGLKPLQRAVRRASRPRAAVVRVANIAAPAEEMLGSQPQAQPAYEVRASTSHSRRLGPCHHTGTP